MNTYIIVHHDELSHYGVKGMRWGVRKDPVYSQTRSNYKAAKKAYSKSFNKAYNFSSRHPVTQFVKKSKNYEKSNSLWDDTYKKAGDVQSAKKDMKAAKQAAKKNSNVSSTAKKVAIGVAAAAAVAGISYAAIKTHQTSKYNKAAHEAVNRALRARKQAGANVHTLYDYSTKRTNITAGNVKRISRHGTLTGNSRRLTKMGAAETRRKFYSHPDRLMKDAPSFNGMGGPGFRTNLKSYNELRRANRQLQDLMAKTPESSWNRYSRNTINKLSRPKKKRYF